MHALLKFPNKIFSLISNFIENLNLFFIHFFYSKALAKVLTTLTVLSILFIAEPVILSFGIVGIIRISRWLLKYTALLWLCALAISNLIDSLDWEQTPVWTLIGIVAVNFFSLRMAIPLILLYMCFSEFANDNKSKSSQVALDLTLIWLTMKIFLFCCSPVAPAVIMSIDTLSTFFHISVILVITEPLMILFEVFCNFALLESLWSAYWDYSNGSKEIYYVNHVATPNNPNWNSNNNVTFTHVVVPSHIIYNQTTTNSNLSMLD